jgi:hypothetical protein
VAVTARLELAHPPDRDAIVSVDLRPVGADLPKGRAKVGWDIGLRQTLRQHRLVGGDEGVDVAGRQVGQAGVGGLRLLRRHGLLDDRRRCGDGRLGKESRCGRKLAGVERSVRGPHPGSGKDGGGTQGGTESKPTGCPSSQPRRVANRILDESQRERRETNGGSDESEARRQRHRAELRLGEHEDRPVP